VHRRLIVAGGGGAAEGVLGVGCLGGFYSGGRGVCVRGGVWGSDPLLGRESLRWTFLPETGRVGSRGVRTFRPFSFPVVEWESSGSWGVFCGQYLWLPLVGCRGRWTRPFFFGCHGQQ